MYGQDEIWVSFTASIADEKVFGVDSELQQVFLNLITNAKEAFIERNIQNRQINITSMTKENYTVVIVDDNAGGIDDSLIEKIFDPYFTTKEYGTGTGLYMVKLVVKTSLKGELKIQNTKAGLRFIIILPNQKIS